MASLMSTLRRGDESLSSAFDHAFAPAHNPWRHLGALAFLCLAVSVVSGIVAYALYDTSVAGAYASGRRLQLDALLLGRLLRGLHRYAADGFMALTVLHLLREAVRGHFLGVRWYSWITGIPLVWLLWIAGLTGLWLLWDERALYSVTATAEWLQALPLSADLLARNFLTPGALSDRFFSLIVFVHIGVPLLLLGGVWIHVERVSQARIWPPLALTLGSLVMLALLALFIPAQSLGPADTGHIAATLSLDWFYQFVHPLVAALSPQTVWLLAAALTLALALLPLWPVRASAGAPGNPARVDLANCNGCARCAADCPFGAVVMIARTDQRHHLQQASVIAGQCAACGICVGACPSSTPFRRIEDLVSGIELPDAPVARLRQQLQQRLAALTETPKIMLFSCRQAADGPVPADAATAVVELECAGMLPPSFIDYALRLGAQGVVIAGCRAADCEFRLGDHWVQERFGGAREPRLRAAAPRNRIAVVWAGRDLQRIRLAMASLRARLTPGARPPGTSPNLLQETLHD
jgi:coenzyme F420-reducing hydrogenase delta subunit/ferredoxin